MPTMPPDRSDHTPDREQQHEHDCSGRQRQRGIAVVPRRVDRAHPEPGTDIRDRLPGEHHRERGEQAAADGDALRARDGVDVAARVSAVVVMRPISARGRQRRVLLQDDSRCSERKEEDLRRPTASPGCAPPPAAPLRARPGGSGAGRRPRDPRPGLAHRGGEHDIEPRSDVDLPDTGSARRRHVIPDARRTVQHQRHRDGSRRAATSSRSIAADCWSSRVSCRPRRRGHPPRSAATNAAASAGSCARWPSARRPCRRPRRAPPPPRSPVSASSSARAAVRATFAW